MTLKLHCHLAAATARASALLRRDVDAAVGGKRDGSLGLGLRVDKAGFNVPGVRMQRLVTHLARVKKASSTPSLALALVSKKRNPNSSASALPCSRVTARFSSQSHLFPMRILFTPGDACCSICACHVRTSTVSCNFQFFLTGKALLVGHVVHDKDTHGAAVVRGGNGAETLLACRISIDISHARGYSPAVSHCVLAGTWIRYPQFEA